MSNGNGTPQTSGWTVTSSQPNTIVDTAGRVTKGYQVTFLTGMGHTGTVFVPDAQYQPEMVRAAIKAQAAIVDAVNTLSEPDTRAK
jgi:class 3 adenylate cyclase